MPSPQPTSKDLRPIHRYITTHDEHGKAIISRTIPSAAPVKDINDGTVQFSLMYTNSGLPQLSKDADIAFYQNHLANAPAITIPEGTVCRVCDFPPDYPAPMHRTVSLDFGVVLEGEVELVLDSGETQHLYRGDVVVQRGTNHAWRSVAPGGGWSRMLFVLQTSEVVRLASGETLVEDEGGIDRGEVERSIARAR
ncbi:hypothetical protein LTR12_006865 [Friedmanniomyces endolithicus]|nr:hypothetical protein LTR74_012334 [Friedmanniomyces endolithicus]KAK1818680.1 hypothetical protein LTR12_006865 [Friedmanniomyces endolithicus]